MDRSNEEICAEVRRWIEKEREKGETNTAALDLLQRLEQLQAVSDPETLLLTTLESTSDDMLRLYLAYYLGCDLASQEAAPILARLLDSPQYEGMKAPYAHGLAQLDSLAYWKSFPSWLLSDSMEVRWSALDMIQSTRLRLNSTERNRLEYLIRYNRRGLLSRKSKKVNAEKVYHHSIAIQCLKNPSEAFDWHQYGLWLGF